MTNGGVANSKVEAKHFGIICIIHSIKPTWVSSPATLTHTHTQRGGICVGLLPTPGLDLLQDGFHLFPILHERPHFCFRPLSNAAARSDMAPELIVNLGHCMRHRTNRPPLCVPRAARGGGGGG